MLESVTILIESTTLTNLGDSEFSAIKYEL